MIHATARAQTGRRGSPAPSRPPAPRSPTPVTPLIQRKPGCACGGTCPRCKSGEHTVMPKLTVGQAPDPLERQADAVADAVVGQGLDRAPAVPAAASPASIQRKPDGIQTAGGGIPSPELEEDELASVGGSNAHFRHAPLQRKEHTPSRPSRRALREAADAVGSAGSPLPASVRSPMERAMGHALENVRVHRDDRAGRAAQAIGARAYTVGHRIAFAPGQYAPETRSGRWLLAHELTHVIQQRTGADGRTPAAAPAIQCDLAVEPPNPEAVAPELTDEEVEEAIAYNRRRFLDPFTIATIRDVLGISKYPAVSDRDLVLAVAQWQAERNMTVDGKVGPGTTQTLVDELGAEGAPDLVTQLRSDNPVNVSTVGAVTRNVPGPATHGLFRLDANFSTPLRRGWIVQELNNTWNEVVCGGAAHPAPPTLHYWEAWWVDGSGNVRLPTSVATPPTHAATPGFDDRWQRGLPAGTRGTFTMTSRLYTTLRLPAGFAIHGVADAGDLPSTAAAPNPDDLGLVAARRRESGTWNGCAGAANIHTP